MDTAALNTDTSTRLTKGYLFCISATIGWAFTGIFIRYLTETYHMPAMVLAFWRDLFAAGSLVVVFAIARPERLRLERRHVGLFLLYGFILAVFNSLWTFSVALNGAAVSTVLAYSSGAFTAILAWRLLREHLGPVKIIAVVLGITGCIFVSGVYDSSAWRLNSLGIITGILSGLAYSFYSLMGKVASNRAIYPWTTMIYSFGIAAVYLLVFNIVSGYFQSEAIVQNLFYLKNEFIGWGILFILAAGPTIGGYGLYIVSLAYLPASVAGLIAMLEPLMTAVLAYLLLAERLSPMQLLGSVMIISCVVILRLFEK